MKYFFVLFILLFSLPSIAGTTSARLKDIARVDGVRENSMMGYGLVVGLAGSGDSRRSKSTIKSIANTLSRFGLIVDNDEISSRNVAAVMVTGTLHSFAEKGDRIDITVSAMGDARSLVGGTLVMTPLQGLDGKMYAIAQGQISVGGYKFELFGNTEQKNHPTVGVVPKGGLVERGLTGSLTDNEGKLNIVLETPDFSTAVKVADVISASGYKAEAVHSSKVQVNVPHSRASLVRAIAKIESLSVVTDSKSLIVVNERTGTIVAGGNVRVKSISVAHGNLQLSMKTKYEVSQPDQVNIGFGDQNSRGRTAIVPNTDIKASESRNSVSEFEDGTTIFELVSALRDLGLTTRDVIIVLQAAEKAGAINGELILQ
ncbi:flagellar basal body P-ring protein FlgI [Motilimonas cestriensis]|uniref:Flagellar P-ring protein n=1 Tax=Motilimonas cestriensis TaxID=2742685 RepID=A0ABS8WFN4_9GAMM|nr:flagellar basal body P-ring protein FlgI [Motilimonas cestriensis]MCE2597113.1 flagellar basal body P-ring protein FlgI [Motilimonas cestriensis]